MTQHSVLSLGRVGAHEMEWYFLVGGEVKEGCLKEGALELIGPLGRGQYGGII